MPKGCHDDRSFATALVRWLGVPSSSAITSNGPLNSEANTAEWSRSVDSYVDGAGLAGAALSTTRRLRCDTPQSRPDSFSVPSTAPRSAQPFQDVNEQSMRGAPGHARRVRNQVTATTPESSVSEVPTRSHPRISNSWTCVLSPRTHREHQSVRVRHGRGSAETMAWQLNLNDSTGR